MLLKDVVVRTHSSVSEGLSCRSAVGASIGCSLGSELPVVATPAWYCQLTIPACARCLTHMLTVVEFLDHTKQEVLRNSPPSLSTETEWFICGFCDCLLCPYCKISSKLSHDLICHRGVVERKEAHSRVVRIGYTFSESYPLGLWFLGDLVVSGHRIGMDMFDEDQFSYFHNHQVTRGSELETAAQSISTLLGLDVDIELLHLIVDTFDRTNLTIEVESKSMLSDVAAGFLTDEVRAELLMRHHEKGFPIIDESVPVPLVIGTGHYPTIALMNHSCDPNLEWRFTDGSATIEMIALKPIAVGDELRISYIDQTLSYNERQTRLQQLYGFRCECPKCMRDSSDSL